MAGLLGAPLAAAPGQPVLTAQEALRLCFPEPMTVERHTLFLTEAQVQAIRERARAGVPSQLVTYYSGRDSSGVQGYAFIETHIVRTMPQTILVHVSPQSVIRSVELLAFHEPADYRAPERWFEQFDGRGIDSDLWLRRGVHNIAGATITSQTTLDVVRRILATVEIAVQGGS